MNLLELMVKIGVDDQASSGIASVADKVKGGLGSAAAAGAAAVGVATAAAASGALAMGKAALDSYANYEQLSGGIAKLFGAAGQSVEEYAASTGLSMDQAAAKYASLEAAQAQVMANAQNAYMTTGQTANEYMEQVSGFAAALTNSLGGDTVAAAAQADVAMRAISDNVNTFGSDAQSVSMAFQGFAKQNYTMLDNLKLGYGGTKTEMERLIADANEWGAANGKASDLSIDSFSDVVTAIQQIQEKQQIAGTTAREASQTIEGSMNSMKAAWGNLLTELGKEDGDIGARLSELADSAGNVIDNVIPRIQQIGEGIAEALPELLPKAMELGGAIFTSVGEGLAASVPSILDAMGTALSDLISTLTDLFVGGVDSIVNGEMDTSLVESALGLLTSVGSAIAENAPLILEALATLGEFVLESIIEFLPSLVEGVMGLANSVVSGITEAGPDIFAGATEFFGNILDALVEALPDIVNGLVDGVLALVDTLIENGPSMLLAAAEFVLNMLTAIVENLPDILSALVDGVASLIGGVIDRAPEMLEAGAELIGGLLDAIGNAAGDMLDAIGGLIQDGIDSIGGFVQDMLDAGGELIQGLVDGILGAPANIGGALMDMVGGGIDGLKNMLGIASPSKLFRQFGEYTMEGFAQGIGRGAGEAERAMLAAADRVYGAARGSVGMTASYGAAAALAGAGTVNNYYSINGMSYMPGTAIAEAVGVVFDAAIEEVRR